jgi:hypothetical protein
VLGFAMAAALLLLLAFTTFWSVPGPGSMALLVAFAAFAGACAGRMRWISHFAFRTKTFDPVLIPHHYAWVASGTAVVLAFLALPAQVGLFGATTGLGLYALAFALGAFSEDVWDALHGRIRALLGKNARDEPVLPEVGGVDHPLDVLDDVVLPDGPANVVVAKLRRHGFAYGHELLAWRAANKLARLADRTGIPPPTLEKLCEILEDLGDRRHVAGGLARATKAQGLGLVVKSE